MRGLTLSNWMPCIAELLETLGVLHLFQLTQGPMNPLAETQPVERAPADPSKDELNRTSLEAHQTLMDISPANVAKFKDVAQFLAEGLKKSKTG